MIWNKWGFNQQRGLGRYLNSLHDSSMLLLLCPSSNSPTHKRKIIILILILILLLIIIPSSGAKRETCAGHGPSWYARLPSQNIDDLMRCLRHQSCGAQRDRSIWCRWHHQLLCGCAEATSRHIKPSETYLLSTFGSSCSILLCVLEINMPGKCKQNMLTIHPVHVPKPFQHHRLTLEKTWKWPIREIWKGREPIRIMKLRCADWDSLLLDFKFGVTLRATPSVCPRRRPSLHIFAGNFRILKRRYCTSKNPHWANESQCLSFNLRVARRNFQCRYSILAPQCCDQWGQWADINIRQ